MSYHPQGLGDISIPVVAKIAQLQNELAIIDQAWDTSIIRDTVPVTFMVDLLKTMLDDVVGPFFTLHQQLAQIPGVGNKIETEPQAIRTWANELLPILLEAVRLRNAGQTTMTVPLDLKQRVLTVWSQFIDAFRADGEAAPTAFETALMLALAQSIVVAGATREMLSNVLDVIKSGFNAIYKPVAAAADLLDKMLKIGMIGLGAYIAFELFAPRGNPSRRRRRRRARR